MDDIEDQATLTEDGEFVFPVTSAAHPRIIEAAGDFGGGTLTFGYEDLAGQFAPYRDAGGDPITATSSAAFRAYATRRGRAAVKLAGAGGTFELLVSVIGA